MNLAECVLHMGAWCSRQRAPEVAKLHATRVGADGRVVETWTAPLPAVSPLYFDGWLEALARAEKEGPVPHGSELKALMIAGLHDDAARQARRTERKSVARSSPCPASPVCLVDQQGCGGGAHPGQVRRSTW